MGYPKSTVVEEKLALKREEQEKEIKKIIKKTFMSEIAQIRKLSLWIFYSTNSNKSLFLFLKL